LFVVNFGPALIDWGNVSHGSLNDAVSAGNMLARGALSVVQNTPVGEQFQISPSQLTIRLD
jgi:hypothetical protein